MVSKGALHYTVLHSALLYIGIVALLVQIGALYIRHFLCSIVSLCVGILVFNLRNLFKFTRLLSPSSPSSFPPHLLRTLSQYPYNLLLTFFSPFCHILIIFFSPLSPLLLIFLSPSSHLNLISSTFPPHLLLLSSSYPPHLFNISF